MERSMVHDVRLLGLRSLRENIRSPESTIPSIFIPIFFLLVNVGQVSKTFPKTTPFLHGQTYAAFQLPLSLMFATTDGAAGGGMIQDILNGYYDKLRATPMSRTALVLGRLVSTFARSFVVGFGLCILALGLGVRFKSGPLGVLVIMLIMSLWGVAFGGITQWVAIKTRNPQVLNVMQIVFFPLLFLTPNFVPRDRLSHPMEILATCNPVTYIIEAMRSLILQGFEWGSILKSVIVLAVALFVVVGANVRLINRSA